MKQCIRCGASKDESEFALNRHGSKIYRYRCNAMISCARERIHILTHAAGYLYPEAHPDTGPVRAQIAFVGAGAL